MKTLNSICIALLLFTITSNAQITKGNWMVGGTAFVNNTQIKNSSGNEVQSSTGISVNPNIGYFFFNQFVSGLNGSFGYSKTKGNSSNSGYGIGPFVRYYFLKPEKTVNVLAEVNYNYSTDFGSSLFTSSYAFKAGPVVYFNSSVGLEILANYQHSYFSADGLSSNNFQLGFGFQIHLEK